MIGRCPAPALSAVEGWQCIEGLNRFASRCRRSVSSPPFIGFSARIPWRTPPQYPCVLHWVRVYTAHSGLTMRSTARSAARLGACQRGYKRVGDRRRQVPCASRIGAAWEAVDGAVRSFPLFEYDRQNSSRRLADLRCRWNISAESTIGGM